MERQEENVEMEEIEKDEDYEEPNDYIVDNRASKEKIKTNLELLLSQNDIIPLLKKINRERNKNTTDIRLDKYIKKVIHS
jgi:hypothetical protein